jgi:hypothetical protein
VTILIELNSCAADSSNCVDYALFTLNCADISCQIASLTPDLAVELARTQENLTSTAFPPGCNVACAFYSTGGITVRASEEKLDTILTWEQTFAAIC